MIPFLLGAMALGSAVSAAGQLQAGREQARALGSEAVEVERAAAERERQFLTRGRIVAGQQVTGFAKGGVMVGSGSPLLLAMETADEIERGAAEIRRGGAIEAASLRSRARSVSRAAHGAALGSLLSGTADVGRVGIAAKVF